MAIKIIGEDSSVTKEITCRKCGSRLQYTPNDEQRDYSSDYTGSKDYYHYVSCPKCANKVVTRNY